MQQLRVLGPDHLQLVDVTPSECGPDDALVRVDVCGICGSDLGYLHIGGVGIPASEPFPLGHEFSGTIEQVGSRVRGFEPGTRVAVNPMTAPNAIGNGGSEGAFSPRVLVRDVVASSALHVLPPHLSSEHGALVEPLAVAFHAVEQADPGPDARVVVLGAGPIGLGVVVALRHRGVRDIVSVDRAALRLERAQKLGADETIDGSQDDVWARLRERHGTAPMFGLPMLATDVFIDCAGAPALLDQAIGNARSGATFVLVALYKEAANLSPVTIMAKELTIRGSMAYGDAFPSVMEFLSAPRPELDAMISHRFPLAQYEAAFATAADPDRAAKVLILPD